MGALIGTLVSTLVGEALKNKMAGNAPLKKSNGKGLIQSKTWWGVMLMGLPMVFKWFGWELSDAGAQELANQAVIVVGGLLAIYGRVKASKPISGRPT